MSLPEQRVAVSWKVLLSSYVLRPSRGTDREGAEGTPGVF